VGNVKDRGGGGVRKGKEEGGEMGRDGGERGQGGDQRLFEKIKVFLKNQKHEPNIVEHTCALCTGHTLVVEKRKGRCW